MRKDIVKIIAAVMFCVLLFNITACKDSEKPAVDSSATTEPETQSDTPSEPETVSPVYTDWSKLTPYEPKQKFTYHAGYCADEKFTARNDYGTLLAYLGQYVKEYDFDATFCGLVNDKGELVTAPVYKNIDFYDDFLVLIRDCPGDDGIVEHIGTIAAPDGHWVHELYAFPNYINSVDVGDGVLVTSTGDSFDVWNTDGEVIMHVEGQEFLDIQDDLLIASESDNSLIVWSTDGEVITRIDGAVFKEKIGYEGSEDFAEKFWWNDWFGDMQNIEIDLFDNKVGYIYYFWYGDDIGDDVEGRLYLDLQSGEVMDTPPKGYPAYIEDDDEPKIDGYDRVYPITDSASGEKYFLGRRIDHEERDNDGYVSYTYTYSLFDCNCKLLVENINPPDGGYYSTDSFFVRAGLYSNVENGYFCYRSLADNKLVFSYPIDEYEYVYEYDD